MACNVDEDKHAVRVIISAIHLLKDNPALKKLEEVGQKDHEYEPIIEYIRTNRNFKQLPQSSKGFKLGGSGQTLRFLLRLKW